MNMLATPGLITAARIVVGVVILILLIGWVLTINPETRNSGIKENKGHETS